MHRFGSGSKLPSATSKSPNIRARVAQRFVHVIHGQPMAIYRRQAPTAFQLENDPCFHVSSYQRVWVQCRIQTNQPTVVCVGRPSRIEIAAMTVAGATPVSPKRMRDSVHSCPTDAVGGSHGGGARRTSASCYCGSRYPKPPDHQR
jgi:hypothetical protein